MDCAIAAGTFQDIATQPCGPAVGDMPQNRLFSAVEIRHVLTSLCDEAELAHPAPRGLPVATGRWSSGFRTLCR